MRGDGLGGVNERDRLLGGEEAKEKGISLEWGRYMYSIVNEVDWGVGGECRVDVEWVVAEGGSGGKGGVIYVVGC